MHGQQNIKKNGYGFQSEVRGRVIGNPAFYAGHRVSEDRIS